MRLVFIIFMILLVGCVTQQPSAPIIPTEQGAPIQTFFCRTDNCTKAFITFISTQDSVDCALYNLNDPQIVSALTLAHARVVIDDNQRIPLPENLSVHRDNSNQLTHNKFCVSDSAVIAGSLNPTSTGIKNDDNNLIIIASQALAENYQEEFNELWNGTFGRGERVRNPIIKYNNAIIQNYFCPEDECKAQVVRELRGAKSTIRFMLYDLTDNDIALMLVESTTRGIDTEGVLEKRRITSDPSKYTTLHDAGVDVHIDGNSGLLHHKVFIIDNVTVITGSYNPTQSGNTRNDENLIIITDPDVAASYLSEYSRVRDQSK